MFVWILIAIAIVCVFYAQDLPKWVNRAKDEGLKAKDLAEKKIKEIKDKNK